MDEYTRITGLLEAGKITAEEARRLLEALEEEARPAAGDGAAELGVRLRRAELFLIAREGVSEPRLEREVEGVTLERSGGGWRLYEPAPGPDVRGLLGFLRGAPQRRVELTVPEGARVRLELGQGTLRSQGRLAGLEGELGQGTARLDRVDALRFELGQGTLGVAEARALDLELGQGTMEVTARLSSGRHRVESGMGTVRLTLLEGSDVRVRLASGLGTLRLVEGGAAREGKGPRAALEATVGSGRARLDVESGMGTVEVRLP